MKKKSLLIVDDEQIILDSLARELTSAGLEVTTAASGEEAVARITTGLFDLVTTDLLMPGLDGFEVLKAAKQRSLQTIVIILTGNGAMESAIDALRLGEETVAVALTGRRPVPRRVASSDRSVVYSAHQAAPR